MKRDFASLSAQEALHVAIFIEERNADIYHQLAEMFAEFRDPESLEIAAAFSEMATEERNHGTILQKRYFERYGTRPCSITEEDIRDFIEVPKLESGELFSIKSAKGGRSPRFLALQIANKAEQNALQFYTKLATASDDPELRRLYQEFVSFESNHSDWLDRKLDEAQRSSDSKPA